MFNFLLKNFIGKQKAIHEPIYAEDIVWQNKVYPYFVITQNNFRYCMHNGLLSRQEILNFKYHLNKCVKNQKKYARTKFNNDAHEIYVKLKDTSISKKQMIKLNEFFQPTLKLADEMNNLEFKKIKHLAVIK